MSKKKCPSCGVCGCTTCCYQITVSGLTFETTNETIVYTLDVTSEGTLNSTFIVCDSSSIPVAFRTEKTDEDGTVTIGCGYGAISTLVYGSPGAYFLQVTIQGPTRYVLTEDVIFRTNISITDEQAAIISSGVCTDFGTVSGSNGLDPEDGEYPFNDGTGSVSVTLVPMCDDTYSVFTVDCSTPETFAQTICDEDDCPCGRTSEQPTCLLVTIKGSDGIDSVYQTGVGVISGSGGREYSFHGPYRRTDGTWWRFIVVDDSPGDTTWGADAAYFEHQCPGDNQDSYSGTYALADDADWSGDVATILAAHQTALTGIGTTVTAAACVCDLADDYVSRILCGDGDPPDGEVTIELVHGDTPCKLVGDNGTYSEVLEWEDGTWTQTVTRNSDSVVVFTATWAGASNDPTGSHPFDGSIWDEDPCTAEPGSLRSEIE